MEYQAGNYDVAVIGAGHAGCEAALASARLGLNVIIFSISLDVIANMPCNPSIGGTAKGHLVKEIDALGGEMGRAADYSTIQSRMLNKGKGPAVHSLRAQCDRQQYHLYMKKILEHQNNLHLKQAEVVDIRVNNNNQVETVVTHLKSVYKVKAVIICTGTYLKGKIFVGDISYESGPDGLHSAISLSNSLSNLGINLRRFKTGTPARVSRQSIRFDKLDLQVGDEPIIPFSSDTTIPLKNKEHCYIAYTNCETHQIVKENVHNSSVYSGLTEGMGPRYCPSIEDKIMRFPDKERHQLFVEPMGLNSNEMYLQGMSTSLPEDIQIQMYRSIKGLDEICIMRNAYAIEYDCCNPLDLYPSLEFKQVNGLFCAGQFNGTSGYEEAAAQGLIAGINAVKYIKNESPLILSRSNSYIGTLIDDLVTKGCNDPYRMLTSRSEYRLVLRQDNADERLTPIGKDLGLISENRWKSFLKKFNYKYNEIKRLHSIIISPSEHVNNFLTSRQTNSINSGIRAIDLLKRPQISYKDLEYIGVRDIISDSEIAEKIETEVKYEGYINKQLLRIEQTKKLESKKLNFKIDYHKIKGLRLEAQDKLSFIKPINIGQASRISGVSPADISVLLIWLKQNTPDHEQLD